MIAPQFTSISKIDMKIIKSSCDIAVLITCHNRRETTLSCLRSVGAQKGLLNLEIKVFLVDDKSSDGTAQAVEAEFPQVTIIKGGGDLYWCGGMRLAWSTACEKNPESVLLLNDDTILSENAIYEMSALSGQQPERRIVVGAISDNEGLRATYGGVCAKSRIGYRLISPSGIPQVCDTFNGNCVLIPRDVIGKIGFLSDEFTHGMADTDFGLRAKSAGFESLLTEAYVGRCETNSRKGAWDDCDLSLKQRWKKLHDPKGLPPKEWKIFLKRHAGYAWPIYYMKLYLKILSPRIWNLFK